ncbi:hypothetical protein ACVWW7_000096 [Bradyrhizobium sp. LM6.9]
MHSVNPVDQATGVWAEDGHPSRLRNLYHPSLRRNSFCTSRFRESYLRNNRSPYSDLSRVFKCGYRPVTVSQNEDGIGHKGNAFEGIVAAVASDLFVLRIYGRDFSRVTDLFVVFERFAARLRRWTRADYRYRVRSQQGR